jgi:thiosulfate dehydrogenase (quinone) large subunit
VRPAAILGAILALNFIYFGGPDNTALQQTHLVLFIVLGWLGAGRCLGLDYYFYKRQRGLWW